MPSIHTILHPTDFSDNARYAFRVACSLAADLSARLVLLHVSPPVAVPIGEALLAQEPGREYYDRLWADLRELQELAAQVRSECRLAEGHPATEILGAAQEVSADMIVMGTHGRTGLRLLLGSVAEQVLRAATCPVVTVKVPGALSAGEPDAGVA